MFLFCYLFLIGKESRSIKIKKTCQEFTQNNFDPNPSTYCSLESYRMLFNPSYTKTTATL